MCIRDRPTTGPPEAGTVMMALLSQARRLHAEDVAGLGVKAYAAEALAAAAQGLDGVDPQRAQDLLELVAPGAHEVGEALGAPLGVQTPRELGLLRGQAPAAAAGVAALAEVTAQRDERRGADGHDVRPESDRLGHVGRRADGAGRDDRGTVADALVAQPLVHDGDGDLQRDAYVVADHLRRRARAPAKAVEVHVVGTGVDDAGGDRGDVVHGRDLHSHRLVAGGFLDRVDQLAQVLDRVDVVMRRRRDGVRAARDAAGGGDVLVDLLAGQMAADARLGALPDLDLHGGAAVEVLRVHAEAPRGHLHDHVVLVLSLIHISEPTRLGMISYAV